MKTALLNERTWLAIAAVRINRCVETITELRDALLQRNIRKSYQMPESEREARTLHYLRQLRIFGRVEEPFKP